MAILERDGNIGAVFVIAEPSMKRADSFRITAIRSRPCSANKINPAREWLTYKGQLLVCAERPSEAQRHRRHR